MQKNLMELYCSKELMLFSVRPTFQATRLGRILQWVQVQSKTSTMLDYPGRVIKRPQTKLVLVGWLTPLIFKVDAKRVFQSHSGRQPR